MTTFMEMYAPEEILSANGSDAHLDKWPTVRVAVSDAFAKIAKGYVPTLVYRSASHMPDPPNHETVKNILTDLQLRAATRVGNMDRVFALQRIQFKNQFASPLDQLRSLAFVSGIVSTLDSIVAAEDKK